MRLPQLLLLSLLPAALHAQVLRGRLTSPVGSAEAGAMVIVLDSAAHPAARTLAGPTGAYGAVLPAAGTYHLRVLRVGFPMWESDPITVASAGVTKSDWVLPAARVELPPLEAKSNKCELRPKDGEATAALLDEGRKAVSAADQLVRSGTLHFRVTRYLRQYDAHGVLTAEIAGDTTDLDTWPVRGLPVARLEQGGFVQETDPEEGPVYFGPDAEVLFSDFFLERHCFDIGKPDKADTTLVPLQFKVVKGQKQADIEGTLWIDRKTLELSHLDFDYTPLPGWAPRGSARGRLDFARLPNGYFMISRWQLRVPVPQKASFRAGYVLFGFEEMGGEVVGE